METTEEEKEAKVEKEEGKKLELDIEEGNIATAAAAALASAATKAKVTHPMHGLDLIFKNSLTDFALTVLCRWFQS